jgi:hypothetical protein
MCPHQHEIIDSWDDNQASPTSQASDLDPYPPSELEELPTLDNKWPAETDYHEPFTSWRAWKVRQGGVDERLPDIAAPEDEIGD